MLPSCLGSAHSPSCGQWPGASGISTGQPQVQSRLRSPPGFQAPGLWDPQGCPHLPTGQPGTETPALDGGDPGCLPILPVSQKGPMRLSLRAGSGRRWLRPTSGSRGSCRGQSPCPSQKGYHALTTHPPPIHPFCLSELRGCSRYHPRQPSPHACPDSWVPVNSATFSSLAATSGPARLSGPCTCPTSMASEEPLKHTGPAQEVQLL